jgi:hypothetical protein
MVRMGIPSTELVKWVARALAEVDETGGLSRLELYHAIDGEGIERLAVFRIDQEDTPTADRLAEDIMATAEQDAESRTMELRQRYELRSFIGDNAENEGIFGFIVTPTSRAGMPHGSSTHAPNERGLIGQMMTHDERNHQLMISSAEATITRLTREVMNKEKIISGQQDNSIKVYELLQQLMDKKQERDLQLAEHTQSAKRWDDFMALVMAMMPLVMAKFLGPKAEGVAAPSLPAKAARDESMMQFVQTVRPDQLPKILSVLDTTQQISLITLLQNFAKESEQRDAQKPEVLRNGSQKVEEEKPEGSPS